MSDVYSMTRSQNHAAITTFITDDIGGSTGSVKRAEQILAGFPHGAEKAIGSAIKRAATSGEATAAREVRKSYYIKASDFTKYTKSKRHVVSTSGGTEVDIYFQGYHIPLLRFDTVVGADGLVKARVKKSSTATQLYHVFRREVGKHGHIGLFERVTSKRLPIEEKLGPSTPQMMEANDDVAQAIGDKVREVFEQRLEHEIMAVMNGWRK